MVLLCDNQLNWENDLEISMKFYEDCEIMYMLTERPLISYKKKGFNEAFLRIKRNLNFCMYHYMIVQ